MLFVGFSTGAIFMYLTVAAQFSSDHSAESVDEVKLSLSRSEVAKALADVPLHEFGMTTLGQRGDEWVLTKKNGIALIFSIDRDLRIRRMIVDPGTHSWNLDLQEVMAIIEHLADPPKPNGELARFHDDDAASRSQVDVASRLRQAFDGPETQPASRINASSGALVIFEPATKRIIVER